MSERYATGEWWTGHRTVTGDELATYERRARQRGSIVTDEPIIHTRQAIHQATAPLGITTRRPDRQCAVCGETYTPRQARQRYCSRRCGARIWNAKRRAA